MGIWLIRMSGACAIRQKQSNSLEMQRRYRLEYDILKQFDVDGICPDYRMKEPLVKYGTYHHLCPEYKVVDCYKKAASQRGLKPNTIKGNASAVACFLHFIQDQQCLSLRMNTEMQPYQTDTKSRYPKYS